MGDSERNKSGSMLQSASVISSVIKVKNRLTDILPDENDGSKCTADGELAKKNSSNDNIKSIVKAVRSKTSESSLNLLTLNKRSVRKSTCKIPTIEKIHEITEEM